MEHMEQKMQELYDAAPVHHVHDSGYFEPHVNSDCGLGDSYSRGFERGTSNWECVTCDSCLKSKPNAD